MKTFLPLVCGVCLFVAGCGPGDSKPAKAEKSAPGHNPLNAPTDYLGAIAKIKKKSDRDLNVIQLNAAIQQFQAAEGRHPKSLQELVDQKYLAAIPPPPPGVQYKYDPATGNYEYEAAAPAKK